MGKIVMQLAMTGQLKHGAPYDRTEPPPILFPRGLNPTEKNKYKKAMRVVGAVVTEGQDALFRHKEPSIEAMSCEAKKLDTAVIGWLCNAQNVRKTKKMTAKITHTFQVHGRFVLGIRIHLE
mmetsp:Transcript_6271/g.17538  ORF Transcript_6271/g.17538 Transcript_6271/m.17538 type:complete len:122 (+) Transcript_6271:372-737(+)